MKFDNHRVQSEEGLKENSDYHAGLLQT